MSSAAAKSIRTATSRIMSTANQLGQRQQQQQQQRRQASTTFKLNTGAEIPAIGFGTWQDKEAQEGAILTALKAGYRHIDGAWIYGTEQAVGNAIRSSGVPRSEIFLTTKLWNHSHHPDDVEPALDASLKNFGTDYVDLYLMHWPSPFGRGDSPFPKDSNGKVIAGDTDYTDTWAAMEKVHKKGKAKAIGISNFSKSEIQRLLSTTSTIPAVHQIEVHPYLQQKAFTKWHEDNGIHVTQYSPFGNSNEVYSKGQKLDKLITDPVLVEIGKKYGRTGAQVALAWGVAHGRTVIPKSKTPLRIEQNLDSDFELTTEDLQRIDALDKRLRFNDPSANFGWNFYADLEGKE